MNFKHNGPKWAFRPNKAPNCENFDLEGLKLHISVKQGISSVPSPFQGSKMLFKLKRDQRCKNFPFWVKIVKVAKMEVSTEKISFLRDLSCLLNRTGLKMSFQKILVLKCQEKWFQD